MRKKPLTLQFARAAIAASCILFAAACNQTSQDETDAAAETGTTEPTLEPLTSETVVDVLTEYERQHPDSIAVISTRHGDIKVRLYKDTPLHRANFVRLAKSGFYDQGEFYRVVKGFAIQGGDSDNREMKNGAYKIPQETDPKYIHKRGALAMARYGDERNPEKESSSHNFYIVLGEPLTEAELRAYEAQHNIKYTPAQIETYKTIGGEPGLDTEYTVFGEVIEGMDVAEKISQEPVGSGKWPTEIVPHKIKMAKQ
ncbi:peptidyl-prolyl cis-trans isomerase B (cyclophilin B) [Pontibacter aydingkolensis]|uniref:peptidylprolyl isomerase n=1 Tax=Pontibacter aydingkolensis TaxID=1911536 RepID=A0ABS7CYB1_9BACT|nr:peptidylprolyl isomerase [Pontibacter aydingkolensis]MBW7468861.1 peptidylprolyl isomerase [Pontibacter aydingkolensis]